MTNTATSSPGPSASSLEHGKHRAAQGVYLKGTLYCLAASVSFGLMFPVMASALTRVDPFTFTSLRYLIAAAVSLV
ncbi:EamA family transporter, partial [Acinetobacter baumannii]